MNRVHNLEAQLRNCCVGSSNAKQSLQCQDIGSLLNKHSIRRFRIETCVPHCSSSDAQTVAILAPEMQGQIDKLQLSSNIADTLYRCYNVQSVVKVMQEHSAVADGELLAVAIGRCAAITNESIETRGTHYALKQQEFSCFLFESELQNSFLQQVESMSSAQITTFLDSMRELSIPNTLVSDILSKSMYQILNLLGANQFSVEPSHVLMLLQALNHYAPIADQTTSPLRQLSTALDANLTTHMHSLHPKLLAEILTQYSKLPFRYQFSSNFVRALETAVPAWGPALPAQLAATIIHTLHGLTGHSNSPSLVTTLETRVLWPLLRAECDVADISACAWSLGQYAPNDAPLSAASLHALETLLISNATSVAPNYLIEILDCLAMSAGAGVYKPGADVALALDVMSTSNMQRCNPHSALVLSGIVVQWQQFLAPSANVMSALLGMPVAFVSSWTPSDKQRFLHNLQQLNHVIAVPDDVTLMLTAPTTNPNATPPTLPSKTTFTPPEEEDRVITRRFAKKPDPESSSFFERADATARRLLGLNRALRSGIAYVAFRSKSAKAARRGDDGSPVELLGERRWRDASRGRDFFGGLVEDLGDGDVDMLEDGVVGGGGLSEVHGRKGRRMTLKEYERATAEGGGGKYGAKRARTLRRKKAFVTKRDKTWKRMYGEQQSMRDALED